MHTDPALMRDALRHEQNQYPNAADIDAEEKIVNDHVTWMAAYRHLRRMDRRSRIAFGVLLCSSFYFLLFPAFSLLLPVGYKNNPYFDDLVSWVMTITYLMLLASLLMMRVYERKHSQAHTKLRLLPDPTYSTPYRNYPPILVGKDLILEIEATSNP